MTTELTKAAQCVLDAYDALDKLDSFIKLAHEMAALRALTQRPAAQEVAPKVIDWHTIALYLDEAHDESLDGRHDVARAMLREVCANIRASLPAPQQATSDDSFVVISYRTNDISLEPTKDFQRINCTVNGIDGTIETRRVDENTVDIGRAVSFADEQATPEPVVGGALERYKRLGIGDEESPIERLRGFLSIALSDQDWLDVEPFLDALTRPDPVETEPVGYQRIFDAIGAATKSPAKGIVEISVTDFTRHIGGNIYTRPAPVETEPVGAPVYQLQSGDGKWIDQTRSSYDYNVKHGNTVRVLYTRPAPGVPEGLIEYLRHVRETFANGPMAHVPQVRGQIIALDVWIDALAAAQAKGGEHG